MAELLQNADDNAYPAGVPPRWGITRVSPGELLAWHNEASPSPSGPHQGGASCP